MKTIQNHLVIGALGCAIGFTPACAPSDGPEPSEELPCEVAAVFDEHCVKCHGEELLYGAPMPLLESADLEAPANSDASIAVHELLLERMRSGPRQMPPPPSPAVPEGQIEVVEAWLEAGRPPRASGEQCADVSKPDAGILGDQHEPPEDCVDFYELRAHGKAEAGDTSPFEVPMQLDEKNGNLYQCFYFDIPYDGDVQGLWFAPIIDDARVVHHWNLWANDGTAGAIGKAGGMSACNANQAGSYMLSGWAPGGSTSNFPDDMGLQMPTGPNARFLLEVHYFNGTNLEDVKDRSGVRFCTAPKDTRPNLAAVHQLGTEGICVPGGQRATASGTCTPRDDMGDIHVTSVWPHMHTLGVHQQVVILREDGTREMLHDKPFSFDSQVTYPLDEAVLRPGDRIETRCTYENPHSYSVPYGEQTQEEMCYAFVVAWPAGSLAMPGGTVLNGTSPLNRCIDNLSVLNSCNGLADAPR